MEFEETRAERFEVFAENEFAWSAKNVVRLAKLTEPGVYEKLSLIT